MPAIATPAAAAAPTTAPRMPSPASPFSPTAIALTTDVAPSTAVIFKKRLKALSPAAIKHPLPFHIVLLLFVHFCFSLPFRHQAYVMPEHFDHWRCHVSVIPSKHRIEFSLYDFSRDRLVKLELSTVCPFAESKKASCSSSVIAVANPSITS